MVRVEHETCSAICRTSIQAILNHKRLTGLAVAVREGQDMAQKLPKLELPESDRIKQLLPYLENIGDKMWFLFWA